MKNEKGRRTGNNGNVGKKGRSGRKPKEFTLFRKRIESQKIDDAEYAFALYAETMRDEDKAIELRLECADWIANRVLGKPKEKTEQSGAVTFRIVYDDTDGESGGGTNDANTPAAAAPKAA